MKLLPTSGPAPRDCSRRRGDASAFTMVEIALCLAIIGFALVAIIGALPWGLGVQKENREETIVTQDANYFMEAIRNGARGLDQLTNNVISITNYWTEWNTNDPTDWKRVRSDTDGYTSYRSPIGLHSRVTSAAVAIDDYTLINGERIVSLLSRSKYEPLGAPIMRSNHVIAIVRALTGSVSDKAPQTNALVLDLGLNYRMLAEVHEVPQANRVTNTAYTASLQNNLHEIRLRFLWPVFPGGKLGKGYQTFRTLAGGQHLTWTDKTNNNHPVFYFDPTLY